MKHTLLFFISFLFVPVALHAQATQSIPVNKGLGIDAHIPIRKDTSAVERAVQKQLEKVRQQEQARQTAQRTQTQRRDSLQLYQEDLANDKNYVSTPQGDILKGSWQACEYFYNWDKHQQGRSSVPVEQYQMQRDIVFLTFGISEDYCTVLAQYRNPATLTPLQLSNHATPNLAHANFQIVVPATQKTQKAKEKRSSWLGEVRNQEYVQSVWPPRKIKRYLKEYMAENCTNVQEALEMKSQGQALRAKQRLVLSGYDSLCEAYQNTFGQPAEVCLQPATCQQAPSKPKQEESFLAIYNAAARH